MSCPDIFDRLFALPDPRRPPADLRRHLADCPACAAALAALTDVEAAVGRLPVPDSAGAKAALLARVTEPDLVITRVPVVAWRPGLADRIAAVKWQHAAGLAAAVALAVGGGWLATRPGPEPVHVAAPRHDLLHKEVRHVVKLSAAGSAADRMAIWTDVAADLRAEVKDVYQIAPDGDMDALAAMFRQAVESGVVAQARKLPAFMPAAERHQRLTAAAAQLAGAEAEATGLLAAARPQAKPVLERMARTARDGKETLDKLARGERA